MPAVGRVHRLIALRGSELVSVAGLFYRHPRSDPRRRAGAQRVGVKSLRGADASRALAPVAEKYRRGIIQMPRLNPNCAGDFLSVQLKLDDIFGLDAQPVCHTGTNEHGVVPGKLSHRLWQFLQPAVVGELSVVDSRVAPNVEFDCLRMARRYLRDLRRNR